MNKNRIHTIKADISGDGPIVYWMSRDQRAADNWALLYAQQLAMERKAPLAVIFCLVPNFLNAARRQYGFMMRGLSETAEKFYSLNIPFFLRKGQPETVLPDFLKEVKASALVCDFDPLRIKRDWQRSVASSTKIPFHEVDAHNIVPCRIVSDKEEHAAYTIRPKIQRLLPDYLEEFPELKRHPYNSAKFSEKSSSGGFYNPKNYSEPDEVPNFTPGEKAAKNILDNFIQNKLDKYSENRNDPSLDAQSNLSPYLHFGHISAQRAALEVINADANEQSKDAFLEELIVCRELSDNFCFHNENYDNFECFRGWAKETLNIHRRDRREYIYTREQFEMARTHDQAWNAAQTEMTDTGKMHGYMRMYWAKKILEWSASPEKALETAIYLNDKYELDGRDPNGYTGIAWSIGGVHDRGWTERPIFGKIRYMNYNGLKRKFKIKEYIDKYLKI